MPSVLSAFSHCFRPASACKQLICEYYGDLVGNLRQAPSAFARFPLLGNGTCPRVLEGGMTQ